MPELAELARATESLIATFVVVVVRAETFAEVLPISVRDEPLPE